MHLQYLKRFYPDFKSKKVLDLGCGRGDFLLGCCREAIDIVGLELNSEYIKIAEGKLKKEGFYPKIIKGEGENMPFPEDFFDFINCTEVLEHVEGPSRVLNECYRILKKGGILFITVHNRFGLRDSHYRLLFLNWMPRFLGKLYIKFAGKEKDIKKCPDRQEIDKMHYYTYQKFKKLAQEIGFDVKDVRNIQIDNPRLILNKIFKKILLLIKKIKISFLLKPIYLILNKFYFNTFHLILIKK